MLLTTLRLTENYYTYDGVRITFNPVESKIYR